MTEQDDQDERSRILYHTLNKWIGNKELVSVRRKLTLTKERMINAGKCGINVFYTGSRSEGMQMKGSDQDVMLFYKTVIVTCPHPYISIPQGRANNSVLWMRDADSSRPGYVTLELVHLGQECPAHLIKSIVPVGKQKFISSEIHRRSYMDYLGKSMKLNVEVNGPATALMDEDSHVSVDTDYVLGLSCPDWPKEANEWISRPRLHGWPDQVLRDQIVQGGCHLVPVGDKTSADTFLQWRISFTTAERKLMYSLTHVQFLVYGLLKYFLKQISGKLEQLLGDTDILSSYIMKTVLFHATENTPDSFWQEKHTFLCFMFCLNILITWVNAGYCPNYFIKRNNMFLGRFDAGNKQKLLHFLIDLHDMKWQCLSVGTFLQPPLGELVENMRNGATETLLPLPSGSECECDLKIFSEISSSICRPDELPVSLALLSKSKSDLDEFLAYVPTVQAVLLIGTESFGKHIHVRGNKEKYKHLRKCKKLLSPLASACTSPGSLTLATYYYQTGNYIRALDICKHTITSFKIYFGGRIKREDKEMYRHQICGQRYTLLQKAQMIFASDILFTQNFAQLCPSHLHDEIEKLERDILNIPPVPYALFLSFLCYYELGDNMRRDTALSLLLYMKSNKYQGSDSTWIVHNLLGICYEMVGDTRKALREYNDSLAVKVFSQYLNPAKERIERLQSLSKGQ
ncbi:uncharacterized protein LOC117337652 [Pecten maximus]|uniref:uncharacterized protein LOC117337652 n=1 Tax=Pecten maximus TaxID=6579 RepID=UPI001458496F|nr:uncharacterized protein LOC117337652 [Pecten maximus]